MQLYRAKSERTCRCGAKIAAGATYYGYRERALSHHEAMHAGTQYPKRILCHPCGEKRKAVREQTQPTT